MQRDLDILEEVASGKAPPTLRLYRWAPPALSLGRFQKAEAVADLEACRRLGVDLVRRPTGGRAILHDRELTYSFVIPTAVLYPAGVILVASSVGLLGAFEILQIVRRSARARGADLAPCPASIRLRP